MLNTRPTSPSDRAPSGHGGGLTDFTSADFRLRRQILDRVHSLQSHGLEGHLDIPLIAVVGSQSAGKSSLIEAISGITLPRNIGTCTRCPIECRLSRSEDDWCCQVYLRQGNKEYPFGDQMMDKSEVEDRIRRAQLAILSGSPNQHEFLTASSPYLPPNAPSFSEDVISVRIWDKNLDDLSFVDLPGLIASVDDEEDGDIERVENLVSKYIAKPSCIILLVVACETDPKNQKARRLTKKIDPRGARTIPVLTKADCISPGGHELWLDLLRSDANVYKRPWHIVKQPNQEQISNGMTWSEAREEEKAFFKHTAPWSKLDESIKTRMGTTPLTRVLSESLFELICKRLPELLQEVEEKMGDIEQDLSALPSKPDADSIAALCKLLEAFKRDIAELVKGCADDEEDGLIQKCRVFRSHFRETIFGQAPTFVPIERSSLSEKYQEQKATSQSSTVLTMENEQRLEPTSLKDPARFIYLDEVRASAESGITRELPDNYPYAVKERYVKQFTANWKRPAMKLFEQMKNAYFEHTTQLIKLHFGPFFSGGLDRTVSRIVHQSLEKCYVKTLERINHCMALEREEPFTCNSEDLATYKCKYLELYKTTRKEFFQQHPELKPSLNAPTARNKALDDYLNQNMARYKDTLLHLMAHDHDEADGVIEIMGEVRAYYQVSYKRFVDNICMNIDYELLKGLSKALEVTLFKEFALNQNGALQRCTDLMQEDPYVEARREELFHDLEQLKLAHKTLEDIPTLHIGEEDPNMPSDSSSVLVSEF